MLGIHNNNLRVTDRSSIILPGCVNDPVSPVNGEVWTNLDTSEIKAVFGGHVCTIPHEGFDRCCLSKNDSQTIDPGVVWTDVEWNVEDHDSNDLHSLSSNIQRITIRKDGFYVFLYKIRMSSDDKFSYDLRIRKNDTVNLLHSESTGVGSKDSSILTIIDETPLVQLNEGDYLSLQTRHDDNFSKDILPIGSFFACERRY